MPTKCVRLEVVFTTTGEVTKTFDTSHFNPAKIDKLEGGLWLNMDHEKYHTRRVTAAQAKKEKP